MLINFKSCVPLRAVCEIVDVGRDAEAWPHTVHGSVNAVNWLEDGVHVRIGVEHFPGEGRAGALVAEDDETLGLAGNEGGVRGGGSHGRHSQCGS